MREIYLFLTILSVLSFGFFWAYERKGPYWSAFLSMISLLAAALFSAFAEAEATTVGKQLIFNLIVFNAFALGYTLGYPYKRSWYGRAVYVYSTMAVFLYFYFLFVVE